MRKRHGMRCGEGDGPPVWRPARSPRLRRKRRQVQRRLRRKRRPSGSCRRAFRLRRPWRCDACGRMRPFRRRRPSGWKRVCGGEWGRRLRIRRQPWHRLPRQRRRGRKKALRFLQAFPFGMSWYSLRTAARAVGKICWQPSDRGDVALPASWRIARKQGRTDARPQTAIAAMRQGGNNSAPSGPSPKAAVRIADVERAEMSKYRVPRRNIGRETGDGRTRARPEIRSMPALGQARQSGRASPAVGRAHESSSSRRQSSTKSWPSLQRNTT